VSFANSAGTRSYVAPFTVNAASTWEYKSITFTMEGGGTNWFNDHQAGLRIRFCTASGSTYIAATGAWISGNYLAGSGQVNMMSAINNYFMLKQVQLEVGAVATGFDFRPFAEELALCQRYFYRIERNAAYPRIHLSAHAAGLDVSLSGAHPVRMRAEPISTLGGSWVAVNFNSPSIINSPDGFLLYGASAGAGNVSFYGDTADDYISFDAEL